MSEHDNKEIDSISGVETTGHEWDGLKELNHPAPRWWLWVFYVCCIWAAGYWVVYPAWPTLSGHTKGMLGWTSHTKLKAEQAEIDARQAVYAGKFKAASFDQIMKDPELYAFAVAGGKAAFKNNCAMCHGSGAAGGKGYPNLNDDDWLWGGKLADIYQTLQFGIRSAHPDTRVSQMPSFGRDGVLKEGEINKVADYVIALSKGEATDAMPGAKIFAENCAACHGDKGQGSRDVGAPKLADGIWLYGGDHETVFTTVYNARAGVMPFWKGRLDENTLRELTVYVHSLGGGEADDAATVAPIDAPVAEPVAATPTEDNNNAATPKEGSTQANDGQQQPTGNTSATTNGAAQ